MRAREWLAVVALIAIVVLLALGTGWTPDFQVVCETNGQHEGDPNRRSDEVPLLQEALKASYPLLPIQEQELAANVVWVINHKLKAITIRFLGFGPEDDPEYVVGDTGFFPKGSIKDNATEKLIQFLAFVRDEVRERSREGRAARTFIASFVAHELRHARQWHVKPVRDLSDPQACPNGLCSRDRIIEAWGKVDYEREALLLGYQMTVPADLLALADFMDGIENGYPAKFAEGGPYYLLSGQRKNPFAQYYLRSGSAVNASGDFAPAQKVIYEGQVAVNQAVRDLYELNERLAAGDEVPNAMEVVNHLVQRVDSYLNVGDPSDSLRKGFPHVVTAENRFHLELERFHKLHG